MSYQYLRLETRGSVGLITLHRPDARNALSLELRAELKQALAELETDADIGAMVITGSDKVFAAGADIKAMQNWSFSDVYQSTQVSAAWEQLGACRKPVIAAVAGYALGAGCELAMMCDFILAADNARFGQPEVTVGTIPGAGGTQRLARFIGKSKTMEMVLTGRLMDAQEAERCGLVSRVLPLAELLDEAVNTAAQIAALSQPIVTLAKEAVNLAFETPLAEGLRFERRSFQATFATADRKEGMTAFIEKRKPVFQHR